MGLDPGDSLESINEITDSVADLLDSVASGDIMDAAGSVIDIAGDIADAAAPVVGLFNPAAGAALSVAGSVLDAVEDGKITLGEVIDVGSAILDYAGLSGAIGSGLEVTSGVNAITEHQVMKMLEKQINGEGITKSDVDVLTDLLNLLNNENMKRAERSGKKNGTNASEGGSEAGGAEGGGGAGGAEGAGGAGGGSIFELIASIFGEKMKEALGRMVDLANQIEGAESEDVAKLTPQFTAAAQEFSYLSQSFNTGINALGEGLKAASRKQ